MAVSKEMEKGHSYFVQQINNISVYRIGSNKGMKVSGKSEKLQRITCNDVNAEKYNVSFPEKNEDVFKNQFHDRYEIVEDLGIKIAE